MRGCLVGLDPVLTAVLYSLQQIREDVLRWTDGLTDAEVWHREGDIAPVGFQLGHMAGSIDRLITYADGRSLTEKQFAALQAEKGIEPSLVELLASLDAALGKAEALVRTTTPAEFGDRRELGRKRIPTTLAGLLIHTVEHSQRHLGELIVVSKLVRLRRQARPLSPL